ncbi:MAG: MBL fold metallo-hydrolase [Saprospiraceae bacterium]|nr:MBL fold metallo-hydrolase [Saprospiraceae bacterium]
MLREHKIFQSELYQTNCSVLVYDECKIVIDPNWLPSEVKNIRTFVDQTHDNTPIFCIYTHADYDHIIGSYLFDDAIGIASQQCVSRGKSSVPQSDIQDFYNTFYINIPTAVDFPKIDIIIKNSEQTLLLEGVQMQFYFLPGHTIDSISVYFPEEEILILGDYLSDIECPWIDNNFELYRMSLMEIEKIILNHPLKCIVPGHGRKMTHQSEALWRIERDLQYLEILESKAEPDEIVDFFNKNYSPNPKLLEIHHLNEKKLYKN